MNDIYTFCYGTLQRDKHNHHFMAGAKFLGEYYTTKDFTLFVNGLPFLSKIPGQGCLGELYKINKNILQRLDRLEGHPSWYRREIIPVYDIETGNMVEAWAYLMSHASELRGGKIIRRF